MSSRSLGQLTVDLVAKTFGFEQGIDKAARKAKSGGKEIESAITGSFKTIGGVIAGFVGALASVDTALRGFNQSVDFADRMDELSARFNISTETLSGWGYAARLTGSDIEQLANIIPKFSKNIADAADAGSEMGKTFAAIGISVKDQSGNLRSFQDLLPEIMDRFKGLNNETTETALAMQLFGRSGAEFLEFLNLGSDGLKKMEDRARELGIVIDSDTAAAAAQFKDRVDDLRAATQGWFIQIASALLPKLEELTVEFTDFVKEGGNARQIADDLAASLRFVSDTATVVHATIRGVTSDIIALANAADAARKASIHGGFNFSGAAESWRNASEARAMAAEESARIERVFAENPVEIRPRVVMVDPSEGFGDYQARKRLEEQSKQYQDALNAIFAGGDRSGGGGASAASREVDQLRQAYDSLAASLDQQIALFGETSEAARVRYETEFGSLVNLDPKLKNYLVYKAEELDAIRALSDQRREEERLQQQELERIEQALQYGREMVSDLQFELELLRMTNAERATAIQLRGMEAEAVQAYGEKIAELNRKTEEEMQRTEIMDGFRDSFATFFEDTISGTKSVKDAFADMLDDINRMILRRITENWVEQLFGAFGSNQSGSAGGNWFSMIAGWFSGGRAGGGTVSPFHAVEVNEAGIEMATVRGRQYLLAGNEPVHITPANRVGMGGTQVNNFVVQGRIDRRTQDQIAAAVGRQSQRAIARNG